MKHLLGQIKHRDNGFNPWLTNTIPANIIEDGKLIHIEISHAYSHFVGKKEILELGFTYVDGVDSGKYSSKPASEIYINPKHEFMLEVLIEDRIKSGHIKNKNSSKVFST